MAPKKKQRRSQRRMGGGRPRKEGERYPSGELKPPKPNAVVVAQRQAALGLTQGAKADLSKGENALDVALARGWLNQDQHRAARAYAVLYRRAGYDLARVKTSTLGEGEGEHAKEARRLGVVEVGGAIVPVRDLNGDPQAQDSLRAIWARLTLDHKAALTETCLADVWPNWVVARIRAPATLLDRRYALLVDGLAVVGAILDPRNRRAHTSANVRVGSGVP